MKMFKKIAAVAVVAAMGVSVAGCGMAAETYTKYVKAVLDSSYKNEHTEYLNQVDTTKEEAEAVYEEGVELMAEALYTYYGVETSYVSDEVLDGYVDLAADMYSKLKYTVNEAVKVDDKYEVTIVIEPIDFWEKSEDPTYDFIFEYWENVDDSLTLEEQEQGYAEELLELLQGYVDNMGYKAAENVVVEIIFDSDGLYGVSEDDWYTVEEKLLDLAYLTVE